MTKRGVVLQNLLNSLGAYPFPIHPAHKPFFRQSVSLYVMRDTGLMVVEHGTAPGYYFFLEQYFFS